MHMEAHYLPELFAYFSDSLNLLQPRSILGFDIYLINK